jgi:arylsulfatase A-like enzyme
MPIILMKMSGWTFFLRRFDLLFEVVLYFVAISLCGALTATVLAALMTPLLLNASSRQRIADIAVKLMVCLAVFLDLRILIGSLMLSMGVQSARLARGVFLAYYAVWLIVMLTPRGRAKAARRLDQSLTDQSTRRAVAGLGAAAAAIIVTEAVVSKVRGAPSLKPLPARRQSKNILLVTFDALTSEDMSTYGYRLPTTPHIDTFAARSSVFENYYSTSTFTTPSCASILTGLQPSEHRIFQIEGRLPEALRPKTLPHLLRAGGFATGALVSNPHAFFFNCDLADGYDVFPDMAYNPADRRFWNATAALHQFGGPGSRDAEFWDLTRLRELAPKIAEERAPRYFARLKSGFAPGASFAQARAAMGRLPDGYFMWVHVMAPHEPYLPDGAHAGRFLPTGEMRTQTEQEFIPYTLPYTPDKQPSVDKVRLRYDEFISEADAAFGDFLTQVERDGKLGNTTVIVSADHGESFDGGIYMHGNAYLTRPPLHVPLIIRTPGQEQSRRVKVTADHTSLAPTILELAGLSRPATMRGSSLAPWLSGESDGAGEGIAFSQYLWSARLFDPIRAGAFGVICDGQQYTVNLGERRSRLRSIEEAHKWDCDHSAENPDLARSMRAKLAARFPEISQLRS